MKTPVTAKTSLASAFGGANLPLGLGGFSGGAASMAATQPKAARPVTSGNHPPVSRTSGNFKGTLDNWVTKRLSRIRESAERSTTTDRAEDLIANDPHAASVIDSMAINTIGTGLIPQSTPHAEILGWTEDQVRDFQIQAEWAFNLWSKEADVTGRLPFWAMQFTTIYSLLACGEYIRIPVMMKDDPARKFSLALQAVHASRLCTPRDMMTNPAIRDGIQTTAYGAPEKYFIANTTDKKPYPQYLSSPDFSQIPARIGHRPGIFHSFIPKTDEQVRGVSIMAPAMKFFRDLSDMLDFTLVGTIITSSFPVFIETSNPFDQTQDADGELYTGVNPGQVLYGKNHQKPHILSHDNPGNNFESFVERILRAVGAAVGMPYEVIAKDFSKTNYSSARAALLEAWRVFSFYQKWLVDAFCQVIWEMVLEEAWLRGMIQLPKGSPDWYIIAPAACRATWIPPKRGHVDPLKEAKSLIELLDADLITMAEANAETGGDWETRITQRGRERNMQRKVNPAPLPKEPAQNE